MSAISLFLSGLVALLTAAPTSAPAGSGAMTSSAPAPHSVRHFVYQFGYNTEVAKSGQGTGTTTIDILGPAPDGGTMISGQDFWWNARQAEQKNTCELYPTGGVSCTERPWHLSAIQLTIFSLLARSYFDGLSGGNHATWHHKYAIKAAVTAGRSAGFSGNLYTWDCDFTMTGKGKPEGSPLVTVQRVGKMKQQGGQYLAADVKTGIAYDPVAKIPVFVSETRAHLPQTSVYNKDLVQLKLLKVSGAPHSSTSTTKAPAPAHT